jgi:anti-sigma factor (TIGR02949 family)
MAEFDCEETKARVHEYLHNELGEQTQQEITAHLALCDSCEQEYDLEVYLNQVIQQSCDEAPPKELADRVLAKIREIQNH